MYNLMSRTPTGDRYSCTMYILMLCTASWDRSKISGFTSSTTSRYRCLIYIFMCRKLSPVLFVFSFYQFLQSFCSFFKAFRRLISSFNVRTWISSCIFIMSLTLKFIHDIHLTHSKMTSIISYRSFKVSFHDI